MLGSGTNLRVLLPALVSGLLSFGFCAAMTVFIFREQSISAAALEENLQSHRAAADLEENIADLAVLLRARVEGAATLNEPILQRIAAAKELADSPEEAALVQRVDESFARYLKKLGEVPAAPGPAREDRILAALNVIEIETLRACEELREHNRLRMILANQEHQDVLRRLSWGLAGVVGSAGLAGLFLGYSVARGLTRSIRRLQVRVQDAAGKLRRDLPAVELAEGTSLDQLDREVQSLVGQIEEVVERLQEKEREVRRAEQLAAVGQLAAGIAHEIRNPLTSIKMLVQVAREGPRPGLPDDDLAVIEKEIRRVEQSLQTFLDFARPPRPAMGPTDLRKVLQETLNLTRGRAGRQNVQVRLETHGEGFVRPADASQLRQVVVNLVLNALDAMPRGGALTLDLAAQPSEIQLSVRDTGGGIAAEVHDRLFEPFVSTRETGSGLGLVVCRRIVEDHGGTIEGENLANGGACFTVRLPRTASAVGETP